MNHQNLECKWQKCETFLRRKERRQKKLIMRFEKKVIFFHILKIRVLIFFQKKVKIWKLSEKRGKSQKG
jgi:hypothetical protein